MAKANSNSFSPPSRLHIAHPELLPPLFPRANICVAAQRSGRGNQPAEKVEAAQINKYSVIKFSSLCWPWLPQPHVLKGTSSGWREGSGLPLDKNLKLCNVFNLRCLCRKEVLIIPFTNIAWTPQPHTQNHLHAYKKATLEPTFTQTRS